MWRTKLLRIFIKTLLKAYNFINSFSFKCMLPIKLFYSILNRNSISILVPKQSGNVVEKRDSKVNFSIYDVMVTETDFSMPESTNILGFDVKIRSMQEVELFVKCVGLSIIWLYPFQYCHCCIRGIPFGHFPLKSPEIAGLRLLMLFKLANKLASNQVYVWMYI